MINLDFPRVSLIISCYNQVSNLEKIFYSLLNQVFTDFEIIVADDGSGPEILELIKKFNHMFVHPIQHVWHEDHGNRRSIIGNQAVIKSKSDYLIFIDGDCILHNKFIIRHFTRKKPGLVLSGRRIMLDEIISNSLTNENIISRKIEQPSFWWKHIKLQELKRGIYMPFIFPIKNFLGRKYWTIGCNFSIYKSDFINVNGYDENIIGWGFDDVNLNERFKLNGYKIRSVTYEAIQYHIFHNQSEMTRTLEEVNEIIHPKVFYASKGIN